MERIVFNSLDDIEDLVLWTRVAKGEISLKEAENFANQLALSSAIRLGLGLET